ncbi:metastasis-associated protein MTA2-like, partial [Onychostruthus taczanowskii]
MAANMYRVGDYVYFENSSSNPYLVRRIEELNKVRPPPCFWGCLLFLRGGEFEEESKQPPMTEQQRHQLKHRELFLSRQFESLPATHIRGKCSVTLLNETDILGQYLEKEVSSVWPKMGLGGDFGGVPTPLSPPRRRAVGTFARALDCSSSIRQPSLHMSAAAASRDITLFHAMDTLQRNGYDLARAMATLVPQGGPVLCRDEMEEWSASEAMLFEEALEKYGKDFNDIRQDFLPWKSLASIVQFYYMWKTTDRYIQQVRAGQGARGAQMGASQSPQWYAWGPPNMQCRLCASCWIYWKKYGGLKTPTQLEGVTRSASEPHSRGHLSRPEAQSLSPYTTSASRAKLLAKNRQTFLLQTTRLTRLSRRLCRDVLQPRRAARRPYAPINANAI